MPVLAVVLLLLGAAGLIVPIVPGLPLLGAAALLFAADRPGLRRRILALPPIARPLRAIRGEPPDETGLSRWERAKLKALRALARAMSAGKR